MSAEAKALPCEGNNGSCVCVSTMLRVQSESYLMFQVASREYRRLKKSNEHHPGYAMSRAYLETLADLPWNTFSGETQAPSTPEALQDAKASSTGRTIAKWATL